MMTSKQIDEAAREAGIVAVMGENALLKFTLLISKYIVYECADMIEESETSDDSHSSQLYSYIFEIKDELRKLGVYE